MKKLFVLLGIIAPSFAHAGEVSSTTPKCVSYAITTLHQGVYVTQYVTTKNACSYPVYYYMCYGNGTANCSYTTGVWSALALRAAQSAQYSMDDVAPHFVFVQECPKGYTTNSPTGIQSAQYCYD